jgi:cell wall-associated NlpC family hydrolase
MTIRQRIATLLLAGTLLSGGALVVTAGDVSAASLPTRSEAATADNISVAAAAALAAVGTDTYAVRLSDTAYAVATRLGTEGGRLYQAWLVADQTHQTALLSALTQVGVPYRRNTSNPGVGFDCSGLTAYAWGQAGLSLTRQSGTQIRNAASRTKETAQAGDLAYYPGHVMMWLGVDDLIVHSPNRGHDVEVTAITSRRAARAKFGNPIG